MGGWILYLAFAAGALVSWRWALVAAPALAVVQFVGLDRGWWGGGLVDGWEFVFLVYAVLCLVLAGAGVLLGAVVARLIARGRTVSRREHALATLALGVLLAIVGVGYHYRPRSDPDLGQFRHGPTVYYLGSSFEGLTLTHVEKGERGALFVYGDCEVPVGFDPGGCSPPLQLQNVTCPGQPTAVAVFGSGEGRAERAARALEPVRRADPRSKPPTAIDENPFGNCFNPSR